MEETKYWDVGVSERWCSGLGVGGVTDVAIIIQITAKLTHKGRRGEAGVEGER
jgi:hypothetical protein